MSVSFVHIFSGVESLSACVIIFIQLNIFRRNYKNKDHNDDTKTAALVFGVLCSIWFALSELVNGCALFVTPVHYTSFVAVIFVIFGSLNMYGYLLQNLYHNFADTSYSISFKMIYLLVFGGLLYAMAFIVFDVTVYLLPNDNKMYAIISVIILTCLDIMISTTLLICFVYRICQIGNNISDTFNRRKSSTVNLRDFVSLKQNLESDIEKVSDKVTKIFTLCIMIILLTQSDFILFLMHLILDKNIFYIIWVVYYPFTRIMVSWLIMLSFDFMNSWYNSCCLYICCNKVKDWCTLKLRQKPNISYDFDTE